MGLAQGNRQTCITNFIYNRQSFVRHVCLLSPGAFVHQTGGGHGTEVAVCESQAVTSM